MFPHAAALERVSGLTHHGESASQCSDPELSAQNSQYNGLSTPSLARNVPNSKKKWSPASHFSLCGITSSIKRNWQGCGAVQHCVSVLHHHSNHEGAMSILFHQFNVTPGRARHGMVKRLPHASQPSTCPHAIAVTARLKNGSYRAISVN